MHRKQTALLLWLALGLGVLQALEAPTAEQRRRYRDDGSLTRRAAAARQFGNHRFSPALLCRAWPNLQRAGLAPAAPGGARPPLQPPSAWSFRALPSHGRVRVLALLIAFADMPPLSAADLIQARLFGDGQGGAPYESLRNYYRRSSYGQLEIEGDTLGWYTTAYPRAAVPETDSGREALIAEALSWYDARGHDFSPYDNDGDGYIDYLVVIWAGPHQEWSDFWWGYQTSFAGDGVSLDGKRPYTYSWQWEAYLPETPRPFTPQTVIHETGHALGLPDYYDYDEDVGPDGGVGGLDMMDATRGDHNAFSKFMLDWIRPAAIGAEGGELRLRPSSAFPDAAVLMPGIGADSPYSEYFLVQHRDRSGNDSGLPGSGLLVWHLDARLQSFWWGGRRWDDFVCDNSYSDHKLLRLMEADGLETIETGNGRGDAGDYYTAGAVFNAVSRPASDAYLPPGAAAMTPTTVSIDGIAAAGADMVCQASALTRFDVGVERVRRGLERSWLLSRAYAELTLRIAPRPAAPPSDQLSIVLFRRDADDGAFREVGRTPGTALQNGLLVCSDRLLDPGKSYTYQVLLYDSGGHVVGVSGRETL